MQRSPILLLLFMSLLAIASHAQVTSLTLISDADDFVGQGRTMFFTPFSGSIFANQNTLNGVSVSFIGTNFESWNLNFAAPDNQLLTVGTYNGAVLYPTQGPGTSGLSVFGDGRGCAAITGSFVVQEITYGVFFPLIDSFDATFEQHCDGLSSAIRGEIRYNAHPFVNVSAPSPFTVTVNQSVSFTVSAADPASHHIALTASGLPDGANFVDNGNNTGTFNWTPLANQTGVHTVVFLGDNLSGNIGTTGHRGAGRAFFHHRGREYFYHSTR
jgi:hypothetical protein